MRRNDINVISGQPIESILATNRVLRNTYLLLGLTFLFSAFTAYFSWKTHVGPMSPILLIVGMYGLMFLTQSLRNSAWGLLAIFAFTGFLGYTLGPILSFYTTTFSNGHQLIMMALGATGIIFFALSGYTLVTRKDFSYLGGFLFVLTMTAVLAMVAGFLFQIPALFLGISVLFVLISSGMILFQTSQIINGGETNYIMATITLYVSLYNLFLSLLQIFGAFNNKE
jgi:modulator of FtsH protease